MRRDTIVEVWVDGVFVATIYPTANGVRLISKYLKPEGVKFKDLAHPAAVTITLDPKSIPL